MRAVVNTASHQIDLVTDKPIPDVPPGSILVKVSHVALNPSDWKHAHEFPNPGAQMGIGALLLHFSLAAIINYPFSASQWLTSLFRTEFSGAVVKLGDNLSKPWNIDDRVLGAVHGAKQKTFHLGAFADYCLMRAHQGCRIPSTMSDAEAATLGMGVITVGTGLYQMLNVPWPDQVHATRSGKILIYGGSTAIGMLAIQLAKLSGMHVLTTSSPHNFEKLRSLGADEVFDCNDKKCAAAIRAATNDELLLVFDCIGEGDSIRICAGSLTSQPGRASYVGNLPYYTEVRDDIWQKWIYAYTTFGEDFEDLGLSWPAVPADQEFAARFWIRTFPIVRPGGLAGVVNGLEELRQGNVSGGKLVYDIAEQ